MTATAQCKLIFQLIADALTDESFASRTFLKRKGGLFKKAHELAVLCSVDVAVIIFGQNKKLYEYSSCDMHEALGRYQYVSPTSFCSFLYAMARRSRLFSVFFSYICTSNTNSIPLVWTSPRAQGTGRFCEQTGG